MRKLKVFGVTCHHPKVRGQVRLIAAVHSRTEFARLIGASQYFVRGWAAETGNPQECNVALLHPMKVFYRPHGATSTDPYLPLP